MSYGSRGDARSAADRSARAAAPTARSFDVVMVKLKGGPAPLVAAARGVRGVTAATRQPAGLLAQLLQNGIVVEAAPVFAASEEAMPSAVRGLAAGPPARLARPRRRGRPSGRAASPA